MKKLLVLFGICLTMMACGGNSVKSVENTVDSDSIVVVDSIDSTVIDSIDSTVVDSIN